MEILINRLSPHQIASPPLAMTGSFVSGAAA